jgi:adenylate cyclase
LLPLVFALMHAADLVRIGGLDQLDNIIYDARLRATMPRTLDGRIVIVDVDEKSLAELGRWPWGRDKLAALADELFDRQKISLLGMDVVFAEADESSGLKRLNELAQNELRDQADVNLLNLLRLNAKKYLYQLYSERVASMRLLPFDPEWDGATNFETK